MPQQPKVWVYTRAYNAEATICRTVESVLNQTYQNIGYMIRDNGSTDRTLEICRSFATRDNRVLLTRNSINNVETDMEEDQSAFALDLSLTNKKGDSPEFGDFKYFCILDADDEYLPDFLEKAVAFAEKETLDIVACGTEMLDGESGKRLGDVSHPDPILLEDARSFSDRFPEYHWHMRQVWGKLYRRGLLDGFLDRYRTLSRREFGGENVSMPYGSDTLYALYAFSQAKRAGILSGRDHRYYVQKHSVSTQFLPFRVESDRILHDVTEQYLQGKCGAVNAENRIFLSAVYANAVKDTLNVLHTAALSGEEKLHEYCRIAESEATKVNFAFPVRQTLQSRDQLLAAAISCHDAKNAPDELPAILAALTPRCAPAFPPERIPLLAAKPALAEALFRDDAEAVLAILLDMLRKNEQSKKYDLPAMVRALSADKPLLRDINDKLFLRRYGNIYLAVWRGQYNEALDNMTGLLLNGAKVDEIFLQLYLNLAALQNQPDAFVFGKIRLAQLYLREG
ncbi:MAG: glycosyltransferase family 2 protein, partial [Lachnospiraceae bacterium]|nr:glycosyltransferase family 2 protein [Lachnospiraceae bacterium]